MYKLVLARVLVYSLYCRDSYSYPRPNLVDSYNLESIDICTVCTRVLYMRVLSIAIPVPSTGMYEYRTCTVLVLYSVQVRPDLGTSYRIYSTVYSTIAV